MDKKVSDLIGENTIKKCSRWTKEIPTDQQEENFKNLDNLKNELRQNQKHQWQWQKELQTKEEQL